MPTDISEHSLLIYRMVFTAKPEMMSKQIRTNYLSGFKKPPVLSGSVSRVNKGFRIFRSTPGSSDLGEKRSETKGFLTEGSY